MNARTWRSIPKQEKEKRRRKRGRENARSWVLQMDRFPPAAAAFKRTIVSLCLRMGQAICSLSSLLIVFWGSHTIPYFPFVNPPEFVWSSVAFMCFAVPWSLMLALMDAYSVIFRRPYCRGLGMLHMINAVDWVLSFMALAGASMAAAVADYMNKRLYFCGRKNCIIILLSISMAFWSSFLLFASSLFGLWNLRRLPSP